MSLALMSLALMSLALKSLAATPASSQGSTLTARRARAATRALLSSNGISALVLASPVELLLASAFELLLA